MKHFSDENSLLKIICSYFLLFPLLNNSSIECWLVPPQVSSTEYWLVSPQVTASFVRSSTSSVHHTHRPPPESQVLLKITITTITWTLDYFCIIYITNPLFKNIFKFIFAAAGLYTDLMLCSYWHEIFPYSHEYQIF